MQVTYKSIAVYVDSKENLLAIPYGESEKYGLAGLDIVMPLSSPYSDQQLESLLLEAMSKSYSQQADDSTGMSSIEKFLNVQGYSKAVKNRRLVALDWFKDRGYVVVPTRYGKGYTLLEDKQIELGHAPAAGLVAQAFREAMKLSKT